MFKGLRTLKEGGKLENLQTEMQKNKMSGLGVREVQWTEKGKIRSGDYTLYYSGGERSERGVAIVVHKSIARSVVKKIACNDIIIAIKLKAEPVNILIMQVYMPTSDYEDDEVENCMTQLKKFLRKMEKVTQTASYWGTGIALLERNRTKTLLDHMD